MSLLAFLFAMSSIGGAAPVMDAPAAQIEHYLARQPRAEDGKDHVVRDADGYVLVVGTVVRVSAGGRPMTLPKMENAKQLILFKKRLIVLTTDGYVYMLVEPPEANDFNWVPLAKYATDVETDCASLFLMRGSWSLLFGKWTEAQSYRPKVPTDACQVKTETTYVSINGALFPSNYFNANCAGEHMSFGTEPIENVQRLEKTDGHVFAVTSDERRILLSRPK